MENYIVSARKYRPSTFESVVGQKALTTTLKNAISTQKLAHAYLFCGPRGVGKTTCARIFAKTINCLSLTVDGEPCNECESCKAFNEQRSYNIHELDAASNNSVEDIRSLIDQVRIPPQIGKYKVYIIDEVHMLSQQAFNAFLKTLEEPPHHAIFILATTEKHKILPTILSRCQIYDFNRISVNDTVEHLQYVASKENINTEPEALNVIAQKADGGMRDALSIFDQVVSFTAGNITYANVIENLNVLDYEYYFRLTDCFLKNNVTGALLLFNDILNKGFEGSHFITGLSSHFRDLLVSRDASTLPLLEVGASIRERYQQQATQCAEKFLFKAMKLCNDCDLNYRVSKNKRLLVEITLIQLSQLTSEGEEDHGRSPEGTIKPAFNQPSGSQGTTTSVSPAVSVPPSSVPPVTHTSPVPSAAVQSSSGSQKIPGESTTTPVIPPVVQKESDIPLHLRANPIPQEKVEKKIPVIKADKLGVSIKKPIVREESSPTTKTVTQQSSQTVADTYEDYIFNENDLNYYWREFANSLPAQESAAKGRMLNMKLSLLNDTDFEVVVDNNFVEKHLMSIADAIQQHLRVRLHNRRITMKIRVSEEKEVVRAYSRVEQFQVMSQKNPALLKLRETFGLEFD